MIHPMFSWLRCHVARKSVSVEWSQRVSRFGYNNHIRRGLLGGAATADGCPPINSTPESVLMVPDYRASSADEAETSSSVLSDSDNGDLRRRLHAEVMRYCPKVLRDRVDDIVQLAWMRLEAAGKRDARNRLPGTSLIKRVAFCAAMDENRRLTRRREVPIESGPERAAPQSVDPERAAEGSEVRRALQDCLFGMLENRRLAVTLHLQGHSTPVTGRLLGWSTAKTESLVYRGLADLRRCLEEKGVTP